VILPEIVRGISLLTRRTCRGVVRFADLLLDAIAQASGSAFQQARQDYAHSLSPTPSDVWFQHLGQLFDRR
jgi:hypothetical protein